MVYLLLDAIGFKGPINAGSSTVGEPPC